MYRPEPGEDGGCPHITCLAAVTNGIAHDGRSAHRVGWVDDDSLMHRFWKSRLPGCILNSDLSLLICNRVCDYAG